MTVKIRAHPLGPFSASVMLSEDEILDLSHSVIFAKRDRASLLAGMRKATEWAKGVRIENSLLELMLKGLVIADFRGGKPKFQRHPQAEAKK